ncbi:4-diphosphocytidyl-2C-methyl-D-erythritol kinase [Janibacter sp. Soil728]|uniref:4-(cytidine 5'-diphospho)-2-C-methyl-D-erythritol kinase n=1 Tax=Janibacter sp. Soil728 TaxID=1736393 RepID=UPI0006F837F0|nr:4-(cytidine 5'-diphospho)-2-C-methyl-D-erythritol kinase [Janibacter sp. Soil728]KRE37481.1 4-diphosphocytidyl-2C-methyl-D-erythritol kinase [Janibacter sp. Soil728]
MTSVLELPAAVTVRAPAKVNLELFVGPLLDDGYHALSTVYQAVGIHDDVTAAESNEWGCSVRGRDADKVPTDESNLALRAALALAEHTGGQDPVHLSIHKQIPVAGGMAGGSADAAAALVACDALWGTALPKEELEEIAAGIGSDVPFLLHGGTCVGSGRGEVVTPVLAKGAYHWVFVPSAATGLSTPKVYSAFDRRTAGTEVQDPRPSTALMSALRSGDPAALAPVLDNDLQADAIALQPAIGELIEAAMGFGALAAIVSGSGPTVAMLASGAEGAIDLAVALTASGVAGDVLRATGPTQGAHVLPTVRAS